MHAFAALTPPTPPALLTCVLQPRAGGTTLVRWKSSCPALAVGFYQLEKTFDVWGIICACGDLSRMLFQ